MARIKRHWRQVPKYHISFPSLASRHFHTQRTYVNFECLTGDFGKSQNFEKQINIPHWDSMPLATLLYLSKIKFHSCNWEWTGPFSLVWRNVYQNSKKLLTLYSARDTNWKRSDARPNGKRWWRAYLDNSGDRGINTWTYLTRWKINKLASLFFPFSVSKTNVCRKNICAVADFYNVYKLAGRVKTQFFLSLYVEEKDSRILSMQCCFFYRSKSKNVNVKCLRRKILMNLMLPMISHIVMFAATATMAFD